MNNLDFVSYNQAQPDVLKDICNVLLDQIQSTLTDATSKLYHGSPVWFINDNPIVGYDVSGEHVNILFWSGQSFNEPGLQAAGKFKAAGIKYTTIDDIDAGQLHKWLKEAVATQWNYRDLRENNGELTKIG